MGGKEGSDQTDTTNRGLDELTRNLNTKFEIANLKTMVKLKVMALKGGKIYPPF